MSLFGIELKFMWNVLRPVAGTVDSADVHRSIYFALLAVLFVSSASSQVPSITQLRVRLIDCRGGKGMKNRWLELYANEAELMTHWNTPRYTRARPLARARTKRGGVATFQITVAMPDTVWVIANVENSGQIRINIKEALQTGFVANDQIRSCRFKPKRLYAAKGKPGEVVYFAERLGFWEKLDGYLTP